MYTEKAKNIFDQEKIRAGEWEIYELSEFSHVLNLVLKRFLMRFCSLPRYLPKTGVVCERLNGGLTIVEKVQQRKFDFCNILSVRLPAFILQIKFSFMRLTCSVSHRERCFSLLL